LSIWWIGDRENKAAVTLIKPKMKIFSGSKEALKFCLNFWSFIKEIKYFKFLLD